MLKIITTLTAGCVCLLAPSCVTTDTAGTSTKPKSTRSNSSSEPTGEKIRNGMTKSQVLRAWGEPSGKDETGRGEIWVYGNQNMLRMIPYAGPFLNVNTAKVIFNHNGRVVDFRNTNSGNVWSQGEGMGGSRFSSW